eukprot:gene13171-14521_t
MAEPSERELITTYFHSGYPNEVIRSFLEKHHGISMSLSTLKRRLRDFGLSRRNNGQVNVDEVRQIIRQELSGSGRLLGYRSIWHSLRLEHHIHFPRRRVAEMIKELDPEGVQLRKRRRLVRRQYRSYGPNFCWHADVLCNELERVREHWNTHRIRSSRMHGQISGIPNVLYYLPERSGAIDCKEKVDDQSITEMETNIVLEEDRNDNIYQEYFHYVLERESLLLPSTQEEAFDLFKKLICFAENT